MDWVLGVTAIASAVLGGVFFAFSTFVMPGLRRLPAHEAVAAMQGINFVAPRSPLLLPLLLSALGSGVVGLHALIGNEVPDQLLRLAGALLGVAAFVITVIANIPRNNTLAALTRGDERVAEEWSSYLTSWTRWNHVRGLAAITSAVLLVLALRLSG